MALQFRYFDAAGNRLTLEQLEALEIVTPAMEHVFAAVAERARRQAGTPEGQPSGTAPE